VEVLALSFSFSSVGSGLLAAFGLGLVIFIHELGHFAVAKWCGVKVERFSIGFGRPIWKYKYGETEYVIAMLPLGGYVKMLGQDDADPGQMTDQQVAKDPRSYTSKTVPQRMAIISAGVINNMVSAVLFFIIALLFGVKSTPAVIGGVTPGMPAWQADLRMGDQIRRIGDREGRQLSFTDIRLAVALSTENQELEVAGERDGKPFTTTVRPMVVEGGMVPTIFAEPMQSLTLPDVESEEEKALLTSPGLSASRATPSFEPGDRLVELNGKPLANYAVLASQLAVHRAETVTLGVRRKKAADSEPLTTITVEPNHFRTLGLKMAIGQITAIRKGSPAENSKMKPGDTITHIVAPDPKVVGVDIDPLQLPDYFADHAGQDVVVKIKREATGGGPTVSEVTLVPDARPGWIERPLMEKDCPLSIPAIGVAYHVLHHVMHVEEGGPAAKAGIKKGDHFDKIRFVFPKDDSKKRPKDFFEVVFAEDDRSWPRAFWLMQDNAPGQIIVTFKSPSEDKPIEQEIAPEPDSNWYLPIRGLAMQPEQETLQAADIGEAAMLGFRRTRDSLVEMRSTISGLFSRRISHKALGGPIRIAETAYHFSQQGVPDLILFMGILSVSLAVLNFMPIPVLDGGHFLLLCWEGIRGKPPSERVVYTATAVGLAMILSLMVFVFYIDISSHFPGK
jgi:regulator of sigma E protease